jgi:ribose 1,5-bisphosphokinase PhnN
MRTAGTSADEGRATVTERAARSAANVTEPSEGFIESADWFRESLAGSFSLGYSASSKQYEITSCVKEL